MNVKEIRAKYVPKFKRELGEDICTEEAIFSMINAMRRGGVVTEREANTIANCVWIAKGLLRNERESK